VKKLLLGLFILSTPILNMAQSSNNKTLVKSDTMITERFLQSFVDAFNAHDIKAIISFMTEDCVFEASAGPEMDGEKFTGQQEVQKALAVCLKSYLANVRWENNPQYNGILLS
jgi:hypothetical protein